MSIKATINLSAAQAKFKRLPGNVLDELDTTMRRLLARLQRHIQDDKLEGQVLKSHHHTLRNAIHVRGPVRDNRGIHGSVGLGNEAWYGLLHEFGGTFNVPARMRRSKNGAFAVRAHTITFPERSFMRTAAREYQAYNIDELKAAVVRGAKK